MTTAKAKKSETPGAPPSLGDVDDYTDPQTQAAVRAILAAKREIARVLGETGVDVQANLALALASVTELEERAASLARRADDVAKYLKTIDLRVVQADVDALARRAAQSQDPEARAQLESAHQARREHLDVLKDLWNTRERIDATLLSI